MFLKQREYDGNAQGGTIERGIRYPVIYCKSDLSDHDASTCLRSRQLFLCFPASTMPRQRVCFTGAPGVLNTGFNGRQLSSTRCARRRLSIPLMSVTPQVFDKTAVPSSASAPSARGKRVAIVGAGLGGLVTALELAEAGCEVSVYDTRPFAGGKVGSWTDKDGNHIEMGLHVFFGCYYSLFDIMRKTGSFDSLLLKEHTHTFVNEGGRVGELDFRLGGVGAPFNGLKAFAGTSQLGAVDKLRNAAALGSSVIVKGILDLDGAMEDIRALDDVSFQDWFLGKGGSMGSIERMWDPVAYALGFINCENISARCMLTIFQLFAARSEASVLRMLEGSPAEFLVKPIVDYIEARGGKIFLRRKIRNMHFTENEDGQFTVTGLDVANGTETDRVVADVYIAACDVPGVQKLVPDAWRAKHKMFANISELDTVPVVTVQLRYDGWVTEAVGGGSSIDNLLYTPDAEFSCFADLAVTSPTHYYKEGEGSLMQAVFTPGDEQIKRTEEELVRRCTEQVARLFPSAENLTVTWSSVVKLARSLYREKPGADRFRPTQKTPVHNFFLAGAYTQQDYIDSMEGACRSGRLAARSVLEVMTAENESL